MPAQTPEPPVTPAALDEIIFRDVVPQIAHLQYATAADQFLIVELLQTLARANPNPAHISTAYTSAFSLVGHRAP
jgi:hypothetical protein